MLMKKWVFVGYSRSHKDGLLPHGRVKDTSEHESWTDETEGADLSKQIPVVMEKGDIVSSITYSFIHPEKIEQRIDGDDRMYAIIFVMILSLKGKI